MSVNLYSIPRYGNAGVAFLGVEFKDTILLIASLFVGIISGMLFGLPAYIAPPIAGYVITVLYLDWKSDKLPGFLLVWLYSRGYAGYSIGFPDRNIVYVGDARPINLTCSHSERE